jgi:Ca2+-binding RTX toxin-like protein
MATYYGTTGTDTFSGGSRDIFVFTPADVGAADSVDGGTQATLLIQGSGAIAASDLVGFRNLSTLAFGNGGLSVTVNDAVPFTATAVSVTGSSGDDTFDAAAVTTGAMYITPGAGADTLLTGSQNDIFYFDIDELTGADFISAGASSGGDDIISFANAGTLTAADFAQVYGVERLVLADGTNHVTLGSTFGQMGVQGSAGDDYVDASATLNGANFNAGEGLDTFIAGSGFSTIAIRAEELAGDTLDGRGRGALAISSIDVLDSTDLANVSGIGSLRFAQDAHIVMDAAFAARNVIAAIQGSAGPDAIDARYNTSGIQWQPGTGDDRLYSGAGDDLFNLVANRLDANDIVSGGAGNDTLFLTGSGATTTALSAADLAGVGGIEGLTLSGAVDVELDDAFASTAQDHRVSFSLSAGNRLQTIDAAALSGENRIYVMTYTASNVLLGGAGDDVFQFAGGAIDAGDTVAGNGGRDTLILNDRVLADAAALSGMSGVELIALGGASAGVHLDDAVLAANGARIAITAGAAQNLVDASAVADAGNGVDVTVSRGTSALTGGAGADIFRFARTSGFAATVTGGDGAAADVLQLRAAGSYAPAMLAGVSGVEQIVLASGGAALALTDALVGTAQAQRLVVAGGAGDDDVDASGVAGAGNRVEFVAGSGADTLTGGAGDDVFHFAPGALTAADAVTGGAGSDRLLLNAAGAVSLGSHVGEIETVSLGIGGIAVAVDDGFAAANAGRLAVRGGAGDDAFDAAAVTVAGFAVETDTGGGDDVLRGGVGSDTFRFLRADLSGADVVVGGEGAGVDTLRLLSSGAIAAADLAGVSGIERLLLASGNDMVAVSQALVASAKGQVLEVLGGGGYDMLSGVGLDGSATLILDGGTGNDVLTGGGAAVLTGGAGADTFRFMARGAAADRATDFASADDTLAFAAAAFDIAGTAFDLLADDATGTADLAGADVIRYAGTALADAGAVAAYLRANGTGAADGAFVLATDGAGRALLWHVTDASGASGTAALVADFGGTALTAFTLADFTLV